MLKYKISHIVLFVLIFSISIAQKKSYNKSKSTTQQKSKGLSREQLEQQRMSLLEEIKQTQNELINLQSNKNASVEELLTLQVKLTARQKLIANINGEIQIIENNLNLVNKDVSNLRTELDTLKKQYAEMVRYSYKNRTSSDLIVFLFSSNSFNDAIRRLHYVKQYRGYRADQANKITSASQQLSNKITVLNAVKQKKDFVLQAQENQNKMLEMETAQKDRVVTELKGREQELTNGLAQKKKKADELNKAIAGAIKHEIEIAQKRAMEEQIRQEKERRMRELAVKKAQMLKKQNDESIAMKKKQEEEAKKIATAKKQAEEKEKQALIEKKKREEQERLTQIEKVKREEQEKKLALERKAREDQERKLIQQQKDREEQERKASKMAEAKRIEREKELAIQKQKQEDEQKQLAKAKKEQEIREKDLAIQKQKQEDKQRELLAEKQRQEEYQRRLIEEKKKRELQETRNANAAPYNNPRYNPSLAISDKQKQLDIAYTNTEEEKPKTKTVKSDDYKYSLTPIERELTNTLEANKGRLPWPVEKGYVIEHFGKNKHPLFNITTENYGVDIRTSRGATARCVFPGEVISILSIQGTGQTVIVSHGSYYTVYGKLSNVNVTIGSKVGLKQKIGNVMIDEDGNANFHFEIWKAGVKGSSTKMNPEYWIAQ